MNFVVSFFSGAVMAWGLCVSRMIDPKKVIGFLDIFGITDRKPEICFDREHFIIAHHLRKRVSDIIFAVGMLLCGIIKYFRV